MKQFLLLALSTLPAFCAPTCLPGSLQDYINLGNGGCQLGVATFSGFTTEPGQTFATPIVASQIQVTPGGASLTPQLQFGVNKTATAPNLLESFFRFNAAGPLLASDRISLTGSATGDGAATATGNICVGGSFSGNAPTGCANSATPIAFVTSNASMLSDSNQFAPASFLDVFVDITADGGAGGSATLNTATVQIGAVPEPATTVLGLTGLALIALRRARRSFLTTKENR